MGKVVFVLLSFVPLLLWGQDMQSEADGGRWYHVLHFQSTAGQTSWEESEFGFGFEYVSGYVLSPRVRAGLGTGLNLLGYGDHKRIVPLFAEVRVFPLERLRHRPYALVDGGYGFAWRDKADEGFIRDIGGGLRLHLAAGMHWKTRKGWELSTDFGYLRQHSSLERNNFWWGGGGENYVREKHRMQRWMLRIGWSF